jgi:hypothetical protein
MLRFLYSKKKENKKIVEQPKHEQSEFINEIKEDVPPIKKTKLKNDSKIKMNITKKIKNVDLNDSD